MNKREQGMQYRVAALEALAHMGYATTRQIAMSLWGTCDGSSRKMAGRTLRWLSAKGYIVTKRDGDNVNGEQLSAVTAAGANWLATNGNPLPFGKAHARDWLRHAHSHRTACNSVYSSTMRELSPNCVWSELEIRAGLAPLTHINYSHDGTEQKKIPDVLLRLPKGFVWIEVEHSWRSDKDLAKVVASMRAMISDKRIAHACFVITSSSAKTIGQRLRKALTHDSQSGWPRQVKELDAKILSGFMSVSTLNNDTLEMQPVKF